MTVRVLSFGCGVQTIALAILNARGEVENPARDLVMADTAGERPETYRYLVEHFRPWIEANGQQLHIVRDPHRSLYDDAIRRRIVPSIHTRWCTTMHKIRPIRRWVRAAGATRQSPADMQIGISADERHRAVDGWPISYVVKRWPLIDLGLSREDCKRIIAAAGLPVPIKSGCWYCPMQRKAQWIQLSSDHPDLAQMALAMEANARTRNPRDVLGAVPLRSILSPDAQQVSFDALLEADEGCVAGMCFV